jgi:hypothetical protein
VNFTSQALRRATLEYSFTAEQAVALVEIIPLVRCVPSPLQRTGVRIPSRAA